MKKVNESIPTLGLSGVIAYAKKHNLGFRRKSSGGRVPFVYLKKDGKEYGPFDPTILTRERLNSKLGISENRMNKKQILEQKLRRTIREEYKKVMSEAFKSPDLVLLKKILRGPYERSAFNEISRGLSIPWSELTPNQVHRIDDPLPGLASKFSNNLVFWIRKDDIRDHQLVAISRGNQILGRKFQRWGSGSSLTSTDVNKTTSDAYGDLTDKNFVKMKSFKAIAERSDFAIAIDLKNDDMISQQDSLKDKRNLRKSNRQGATALMSNKEFKQKNIMRYEEIIKNRNFEETNVDKLVEKVVKEIAPAKYTELLSQSRDKVGVDNYYDNNSLSGFSRLVDRMLEYYDRYIRDRRSQDKARKKPEWDLRDESWAERKNKEAVNDMVEVYKKIKNFKFGDRA